MENRPIEVSAPDVEKAIERGLALLGLAREKADIEIVDHGSRGILGIGARDAVVRLQPITLSEGTAVPNAHQNEDVSWNEEVSRNEGASQSKNHEATPSPSAHLPESEPEESVNAVAEAKPEQEPSDEYTLSQEQTADIAQQTLAELLSKMGIECQVVLRQDGTPQDEFMPLTLDVLGDDLKILIGRQGEVLDALQYITRLIVSREVEHWVNLVVDVEKYKQRRAKSLKQLARRIAERVARTKQPVALEPMPPNERRVIHLALQDHPTVTTQSVGKGENRKVTIIPRR